MQALPTLHAWKLGNTTKVLKKWRSWYLKSNSLVVFFSIGLGLEYILIFWIFIAINPLFSGNKELAIEMYRNGIAELEKGIQVDCSSGKG